MAPTSLTAASSSIPPSCSASSCSWSSSRRRRSGGGSPDDLGIRARVAVAALALQFTYGLVFAWGAVAPHVRATEHWPDALIGAVFSATPLGYGTATVIGGRLADRLPPRRLCWAAVTLLVAGFTIAFLLPSPWTFVGAYSFLALGLGGGIALTGALGAAAQTFPQRVGAFGGLLTGTYALGAVVQVPVVEWLAGGHSWIDTLRLVGGALSLLAVSAALLMPSLPAPRTAHDRASLGSVLSRPLILAGMVFEAMAPPVGAYAFVNAGLYSLGLGLGGALAAVALVGVAVGNTAGRLGAGVLADRFGTDPVLGAICGCELVAGLLAATGAAPLVVVGAAGCGLALGGAAGAMARMAAEAAPDASHSAFGLLFGGYAAGALAGPLVGAAIGRGSPPWALLGLLAVPGAAALLARRRSTPRPGPAPAARR